MTSPAPKAAGESPGQPTFDLQISDPASLLNEVARRYGSSERILMEYIDNALDDAEILYLDNAEAYPFEVCIEIIIDRHQRYVTVRDNCRGMEREDLERIVGKVGESKKRGITWINGRFGFGVHAFRAAVESIRFRTKNKMEGWKSVVSANLRTLFS
jgi:HSP90 family molecular chaperone